MKFFSNPSPLWRLCHNRNPRGKAVGFQSFRMRVFYVMGNRRLYEVKGIHILGTSESELLRVTALNLFHPTASPLSQEVVFLCCDTVSWRRGEGLGIHHRSFPTNVTLMLHPAEG
jgi:hypothetical protein